LYATGGGSNSGLENSNLNQSDKQKENYDETNQIQVKKKALIQLILINN
jgi:hypothetical protein